MPISPGRKPTRPQPCAKLPESSKGSPTQSGRTAKLVPLLRLRHLGDRRFDYLVPPDLQDRVAVGSIVRAPFGKRTVRAVVLELNDDSDGLPPETLRPLEAVGEERVPDELLSLARQVADRYLASYESCLRLVVPPSTRGRSGFADKRRLSWVDRPTGEDIPPRPSAGFALTAKQQRLLGALPPGGALAARLCESAGVGRSVLHALLAKGLLVLCEGPRLGDQATKDVAAGGSAAGGDYPAGESVTGEGVAPAHGSESRSSSVEPQPQGGPCLRVGQQEVLGNLTAAYRDKESTYRLLWGVTGAGKTEIYLRLIEHVLADGAGAILLVPEIALTPQMISRVRSRFGGKVGVLHSGLGRAERTREYRRIAAGLAPVVVGARSAVFAPLPRLRLVIVDEAHDASYKQEEEPRYHASTVALMRLAMHDGLLVEGTATPLVESMRDPEVRVRLSRRAIGKEPSIEVIDMRHQSSGELLSPRAREVLAETLRSGEQAIVLLNRRGYAAHVHCESCGHVMRCVDCELSLTYHSSSRRLVCHSCGRIYFQPPRCPACGGPPLARGAPGTERLDQELRRLVPRNLVFRMDSDVVSGEAGAIAILEAFGGSRPGVLVGTQMVAKGHDFPAVTLVVVADADTGLYFPDFRAAERTFQLLTQVAGRAGRADRSGRVVVQTWNPDVPCIRMALQRDEQGFYADELHTRRRLGYPPFREIVRLMTLCEDGERAGAGARYLAEQLSPHFAAHELRGPVRLPASRGRERWHLLVLSNDGERMRALISEALSQLREPYRRRGVILVADVDPFTFG
ncbi:MAG: primosomal protein N' [Actinobacteria bacterium]|nr:primosomal protein N' [Actinomycetota bacterium]